MRLDSWHEDSELGTWTQHDWRPDALAGMVESVSLFDGMLRQRRQRYYPTGELDLVLHLDGSEPYRIIEGQPASAFPTACLAGHIVSPVVIEAPPVATRVLSVRLRPAGAYGLIGVPLHELTGAAVDLRDVLGNDAFRLVERLDEADSEASRLRLVAGWVADRLSAHPTTDPDVRYVVGEIERTGGRTPIASILGQIGGSQKRFTNAFEEQVGVKPKLYSRIVRFRGLASALRSSEDALAQTALVHGYYDQSHMNADVREFAGMSPGQFLAATPYPESSSLAD